MERLKVGIIGTGMAFERLHYPAFQELKEKYEIAAICDVDSQKAAQWGRRLNLTDNNIYNDYRMLAARPDLQIFDIMVPISLNFQVTEAVAAIIAGQKKAIIAEKPLAPTLEEAKACAQLPEKYSIPILIAENYRYNEDSTLINELINNGHLGEVDYFIWNKVKNFPSDISKDTFLAKEWRQHPEFPGGFFYDAAVHDFAALRHFFGPIDEVVAYGQKKEVTFNQLAVVNAIFRFHSGLTGSYIFYNAGPEMQRPLIGLRILGQKGELYHEEKDCGVLNLTYNDGTNRAISYQPGRGYYNELLNLYNAFIGQETINVTPEIAFGDAKTALAILESLEEETPVKVDENDYQDFDYQPYKEVDSRERPRDFYMS